MASTLSNHYKHEKMSGSIDLTGDSIKIILMDTGFTFDPDAHATYAAVSASELATGNGYTQNTLVLANPVLTEDDTNDWAQVVFDDASWTAAGGAIGPTAGAILFDDTTADDTVVGYIDFLTDRTADDGTPFNVTNITIREA